MYITEVLPLIKNAPSEPLSYYTSQTLSSGSIVTLPLRKKIVPALVVSQSDAPLSKLTLKAAAFRLRRLPQQVSTTRLPQLTMELAQVLLDRVPSQLGTILHALLPTEIITGEHLSPATNIPLPDCQYRTTLLQDVFFTRIQAHKLTIRETFARRGSVLLVAPTHTDAVQLFEALSHGIEKRSILLTHHLTKKQRAAAYATLEDFSLTKLVVVTPSHLTVHRPDIMHIILEHARSPHYIQKQRPYLHYTEVARLRAKHTRVPLTIADILPHTEDEYQRREGVLEPSDEPAQRLSFSSSVKVLTAPKTFKKPFLPLYDKTIATIESCLKDKQRVFVYAARRGMAPMIVCSDCGHIFRCPTSGAPYSLFKTEHNGEEQRWFVSVTGTRVRAFDVCTACGSWRLTELGVGIQRIEAQLREAFPNTAIIVFDSSTATTPRKRLQLIAAFEDTKGAILLGTSMTLASITDQVDCTVVSSLEALRSHTTWRAEEDALAVLLTLRDKTTDTLYLQTKHEAEEGLVTYAKSGQMEQFYSEEIALREQLSYPPFVTFVHVLFIGDREHTAATEQLIKETLNTPDMRFYSHPTSTKERTTRYGLLRIPKTDWPDQELLNKLRQLPPSIRIEINPERLV